jgi:hypothetical protein
MHHKMSNQGERLSHGFFIKRVMLCWNPGCMGGATGWAHIHSIGPTAVSTRELRAQVPSSNAAVASIRGR